MTTALKLTALDRRILRELWDESGRPRRQGDLARAVYGRSWPHRVTAEQITELRGVLLGAQHLGLAKRARGGWWTITPLGRRAVEDGSA